MTELLPGLHLIDPPTGDPGFTTHIYLLKDGPNDWTLIDAGLPGSDRPVRAYLEAQKIDPRAVKRILVTHLHRDHVGALKALVGVTGAKVHAHWIEATFLAGRPKYDGPGTPPAEPIEVDVVLKDLDRVDAFGGLVAYHLPGHTAGHTGYFQPDRKILFSGDLFFGVDRKATLTTPEYTLHMGTAQVSAMRVAGLPVESLMSYHGGPWITGGREQIAAVVRGIR